MTTSPLPLTPRQFEIARLAASGLTRPQIAALLVLSPLTVKTHLQDTYECLGFASVARLATVITLYDLGETARARALCPALAEEGSTWSA